MHAISSILDRFYFPMHTALSQVTVSLWKPETAGKKLQWEQTGMKRDSGQASLTKQRMMLRAKQAASGWPYNACNHLPSFLLGAQGNKEHERS